MWLTLFAVAAVVLAVALIVRECRRPLDTRMYDPAMVRHLRVSYPLDEDGEERGAA